MKKFAKGCLITALSMIFIGIIIVIICIIILIEKITIKNDFE